ncbi:hypothetical protein [Pseudothermotoga thermarum]|uniref:Uncharacterized protein n=1 Tax=Pseudothermotoga thermarum DSM 5069 TaxID=688269 RepID=F7YXC0_9THEM|nr:hypothetical protein [Pseudothermotoga thermarum]AEH51551.1 hypothetical protein Theth_1496 [Pseudothermotoga thermarum DSM 5069]
MQIPINPTGRQEIHQLESILLFATLFRPEVLEIIRDPAERLTWVDSLAVAAGAIAREKAGMTASEIARELGRTDQTIRKHLKGESKAGELVRETYELIKSGKLDDLLKTIETADKSGLAEAVSKEEFEKLRSQNEELTKKVKELENKYETLKGKIKELANLLD